MGASTVAQLIAQGKAENGYNNTGITANDQWVSFFNDALRDLVDDVGIEKVGTLSFTTNQREYDMPTDFYSLIIMNDSTNKRVVKRRHYDQESPPGYWIFYRGGSYVMDLYHYSFDQTFTYVYQAYPEELLLSNINTQRPQVPSVGEKALVYYAISKALRNNNEIGQAQDYEALYERERMKIRNAAAKGVN